MNSNCKWVKSESNVRPIEFDNVNSPTTVYLRKNIKQVERTDEITKQKYTMFKYDECAMPIETYKDECIEYLMAENKALSEQQTDTELALCELYESKAVK